MRPITGGSTVLSRTGYTRMPRPAGEGGSCVDHVGRIASPGGVLASRCRCGPGHGRTEDHGDAHRRRPSGSARRPVCGKRAAVICRRSENRGPNLSEELLCIGMRSEATGEGSGNRPSRSTRPSAEVRSEPMPDSILRTPVRHMSGIRVLYGHSSTEMTLYYIGGSMDKLRSTLDCIDRPARPMLPQAPFGVPRTMPKRAVL